jgi:hypothetical protein
MDMSLAWKIGFLSENRKYHMLNGSVQRLTDRRFMQAENGRVEGDMESLMNNSKPYSNFVELSVIPAVNKQGSSRLSHYRDELVHDTTRHLSKFMFCFLTKERFFFVSGTKAVVRIQEERNTMLLFLSAPITQSPG